VEIELALNIFNGYFFFHFNSFEASYDIIYGEVFKPSHDRAIKELFDTKEHTITPVATRGAPCSHLNRTVRIGAFNLGCLFGE
jgi:hypothetical protein